MQDGNIQCMHGIEGSTPAMTVFNLNCSHNFVAKSRQWIIGSTIYIAVARKETACIV